MFSSSTREQNEKHSDVVVATPKSPLQTPRDPSIRLRRFNEESKTPRCNGAGNPRSRSGCVVCRIRHIKCDEQKPSCQKCLSTGRTCEGYTNLPPKRARKVAPSASKTQAIILPMPYRPSMDIEGTYAERRSFQFIQAKNPADIFGKCEVDLWNIVVLQFSHSHPAVRQSLLALSSAYEVYEQKKDCTIKHTNLAYAEPHALLQYSKAVASLARGMGSPENDTRAVLISCLIFIWIEVMLGNMDTVFKHLVGGVNILEEQKANARRTEVPGGMFQFDIDGIYISIARSLLRLRFQTSVELQNLQDFNLTMPDSSGRDPLEGLKPPVASTVQISRGSNIRSLPQLEKLLHFSENATCLEFIFIDHERIHKRTLGQKKPEGFYRDRNANMTRRGKDRSLPNLYNELDRVTIRAIHYILDAAKEEDDDDDETGPFQTLVDLVEEISLTRKNMDSPRVLDVGVLPSLFYTIMWCRNTSVKCKAWMLLRNGPRGEGFWQRDQIVAFLEAKVGVEDGEKDPTNLEE